MLTRSSAPGNHRWIAVLVLFTLSILHDTAGAQGLASGAIGGVVRDASGGVLPGVTVEASSPALIEKTRTVVTDEQGLYKIIDLRPGDYVVTFTLPGFNTFRREGIELTTGFTASVNAEMKVGGLEETITVSGAAPIVDVQNVNQQKVFARALVEALPTNRTVNQFIALIPGAQYGQGGASSQDVGGNKGEDVQGFQIHGSRVDDFQQLRQGMFFGTMVAAGNRMTSVNPAVIEETVIQTSGATADSESGGAIVNIINRDGGNTWRGSWASDFSSRALQSSNLDDELRARGQTTAPFIKKRYDVGGGVGGPLKRDRIWWFGSWRYWTASDYYPGNYWNATHGSLFYTPDPNRVAYSNNYYQELTGRVTVQATRNNKFSGFFTTEKNCNCFGSIPQAIVSPEAASDNPYWPSVKGQMNWNYTASNKLLFEAGFVFVDGMWNRRSPSNTYTARSIVDSSRNYTYGTRLGPGEQEFGQTNQQFAVSYVTGSHNLKSGVQFRSGGRRSFDLRGVVADWNLGDNELMKLYKKNPLTGTGLPAGDNVTYTFSGRIPQSVTYYAGPLGDNMRLNSLGLYLQDQWTIDRLTLNVGVRYDSVDGQILVVDLPPGTFVPARHFDANKDAIGWKDVGPRVGAAYDLFGTGRTAIKGFVGRYVNFEAFGGGVGGGPILPSIAPSNLIVTTATRAWSDNGDYIPQESELGPLSDMRFGQVVQATKFADEVTHGFGNRGYSWQASLQLQHELRPGLGINLGYFRTWYGNFRVTDNLAVGPSDFNEYCVSAPANSALPGGGGNQICGVYDVTPAKFGQVDNLVRLAPKGAQKDIFNGIDATMNLRFGAGGVVQGGVSIGRQMTDICYTNDDPSLLAQAASTTSLTPRTSDFCKVVPPWSSGTQVKFAAVYPLKWALQLSGSYANNPPIDTTASLVATNAQVSTALGRNLAACGTRVPCNATATIELMRPKTYFQEPRVQQIDLRLTRTFRTGNFRVMPQLDLFNILNDNSVQEIVRRYGPAWRNATTVLGPRVMKFGVKLDF
jgi:hypothetical protein